MNQIILGHILFAIGAFGMGAIISWFITKHRTINRIVSSYDPVGTLRVDSSVPDEPPMLFLEINRGVGDILERDLVMLEVSTESYLDDPRD